MSDCPTCTRYGRSECAAHAFEPTAQAQTLLEATDTHELLTKAYALTHRMHDQRTDHADLRAARDMITAELVRRADNND